MTNPQNNSNLAPWKWALIGASSTLVLALAGFGLYNLLNPKTSSILTSTSTSTSLATGTPEISVAKQLIGQWQGQISGQSVTLIFTQEGKLFILDTPTSATEMEYQTNVNPQQKDLDILVGGKITARTIFDLTADGQLRLELDNLGESRPTSFSSNARIFQKISEQTTLPANVQVVNLQNQQNKARQSEAKQYVSSMNRAQQAFYAEYATFSSSIEKLGIGIKSETENYSYSIVLSNDNRWVQAIGLAKRDGLKNYTGIVSLIKSPNDESTSTQARLCESNQPSKELPGTPISTNSPDLQCPSGYSDVLR
ncbi:MULTISPECIES: type IV pilin-like G/H family protein [unclassified Microcoleus]|uniref:type IV pilin-like G/H family protein n=1 Tax=unclassified Microcoleus TaxID=2642155 RepID=UPI002FD19CE4